MPEKGESKQAETRLSAGEHWRKVLHTSPIRYAGPTRCQLAQALNAGGRLHGLAQLQFAHMYAENVLALQQCREIAGHMAIKSSGTEKRLRAKWIRGKWQCEE
jgi:hypothetical protein